MSTLSRSLNLELSEFCGVIIWEDSSTEEDPFGIDVELNLLKAASISSDVNPLLRRKDFFVSKELPTTLLFWRNLTAVTTSI